jgi:hypothetical protein
MGYSLVLIERYAKNGRIRQSGWIAGQFGGVNDLRLGHGPEADAVKTNEEVRVYMAERNAILDKEWRMGYWQWVEDRMERKKIIPEFVEEHFEPAASTNAASLQR